MKKILLATGLIMILSTFAALSAKADRWPDRDWRRDRRDWRHERRIERREMHRDWRWERRHPYYPCRPRVYFYF